MKHLLQSAEFWVAVSVAVVLKLASSDSITPFGALATTVTAIGSALVFTAPVVTYLALDPATYSTATAALIALTFEHLARQLLRLRLVDLIKAWRGK